MHLTRNSRTIPGPAAPVPAEPGERLVFDVEGMTCAACARRVETVLGRQAGVADAVVNFATGQAVVTLARPSPPGALVEAVSRIGYGLTPHVQDAGPPTPLTRPGPPASAWSSAPSSQPPWCSPT